MKKFFILTGLASALFFSCSSTNTPAPEYITDSRSYFDEAIYLSATGEGSTKTQARENAAVELSRYLNTSISHQSTITTVLSDTDGKLSSSETLTNQTTTQTQFTFKGLNYTEYYQNNKTWYVTVYIERKAAYDQFNIETAVLKNEFLSLYDTAKNLDPLSSYPYFSKAQALSQKLLDRIYTLTAISPSLTEDEYASCLKKIASIETEKKNAVAGSTISILPIENDFESIIFTQVEASIRKAGFMTTKGITGKYLVTCQLNLNQTSEGDEGDELLVATPSIDLKITYGEKTVHSFTTKADKKTVAFTSEKLRRESLKKLAARISEEFTGLNSAVQESAPR